MTPAKSFLRPSRVVTVCLLIALVAFGTAQKPQTKKKPNQTKGTQQMAGAYVKFGEIYSLKSGVNFQILRAAYTLEHFPSYGGLQNTPDKKLVVLDIAVKNYRTSDLDFGGAGGDFVTLVDAAGNKYGGEAQLKSHGVRETYLTLKPGQGVGQTALNDPYRVGFSVPLDAEITKIIVNQPRLGKSEQVLRYVMAGTDKEADPANTIAPLPAEARDPASKAGAVALKEGKATIGATLVAGGFTYQVQKVESVTSPLSEKYTPSEGHRYVVMTLRIVNVDARELSFYDATPRDAEIRDADGEKYPVIGWLKASSTDEPTQGLMSPDDARVIRAVFEVPTGAKLASLTLKGSYYPWKLDLAGV